MDYTPTFELGGYAEVRTAYAVGVEGVPWNLYERVRPSFKIAPAERLTAEAVVEASVAQGRDGVGEAITLIEASELGPIMGQAGCSYSEAARYTAVSDYLSVERLHVDFNLPSMDLSLGRQALRWGSGLVFHPTDIYSEVLVTEPWREPQGVNAFKANLPMGEGGIVGVLAVDDDLSGLYPGKKGTFAGVPASGAVRATVRAVDTDFTGVGIVKSDGELFGGVDLRGTLGVGWWVEGGYHARAATLQDTLGVNYLETVVGADYSFSVLQMLYVAAEYRYDGSGAEPDDYSFVQRLGGGDSVEISCVDGMPDPADSGYTITPDLSSATSGGTTRATLGRHYVDGAVRLTVNNDVSISTSAVFNVMDGTGVLIPDAAFNVGERVAVHVGAQIPVGKDGEFNPDTSDLTVHVSGAGVNASADLSGLVPVATAQAWLRYSF